MTKIVVCIPLSWMFVPRAFFLNCMGMVQQAPKDGIELVLLANNACYMDLARDRLVSAALLHKPHYILWLDADQVYPLDTPKVLARHMSGSRLVVGGVTPKRDNGKPLMYKFIEEDGEFACRNIDKPLNQGLIEVDALGFGGIMTHPKVFNKIPFPRFKMWTTSKAYVGEDVEFFRLCREHNVKVWCDTNLQYGHLHTKPVIFNNQYNKEGGQ